MIYCVNAEIVWIFFPQKLNYLSNQSAGSNIAQYYSIYSNLSTIAHAFFSLKRFARLSGSKYSDFLLWQCILYISLREACVVFMPSMHIQMAAFIIQI